MSHLWGWEAVLMLQLNLHMYHGRSAIEKLRLIQRSDVIPFLGEVGYWGSIIRQLFARLKERFTSFSDMLEQADPLLEKECSSWRREGEMYMLNHEQFLFLISTLKSLGPHLHYLFVVQIAELERALGSSRLASKEGELITSNYYNGTNNNNNSTPSLYRWHSRLEI